MMRWFLWILGLLVVAACAGLFFIKGPDDEPLLTVDDVLPAPEPEPADTVTVYKWQDEHGRWHFSNEPVDGPGVETMELSGEISIISDLGAGSVRPSEDSDGNFSLPGGASTAEIRNTIKSALELEETLEAREQEIDQRTRQ